MLTPTITNVPPHHSFGLLEFCLRGCHSFWNYVCRSCGSCSGTTALFLCRPRVLLRGFAIQAAAQFLATPHYSDGGFCCTVNIFAWLKCYMKLPLSALSQVFVIRLIAPPMVTGMPPFFAVQSSFLFPNNVWKTWQEHLWRTQLNTEETLQDLDTQRQSWEATARSDVYM